MRYKVCRFVDDLHFHYASKGNWTKTEEWIDYAMDKMLWSLREDDYADGIAAPDTTVHQWLFRQQLKREINKKDV